MHECIHWKDRTAWGQGYDYAAVACMVVRQAMEPPTPSFLASSNILAYLKEILQWSLIVWQLPRVVDLCSKSRCGWPEKWLWFSKFRPHKAQSCILNSPSPNLRSATGTEVACSNNHFLVYLVHTTLDNKSQCQDPYFRSYILTQIKRKGSKKQYSG